MSFREYGNIVEESPRDFAQFGKIVEETPRAKSILSAPIKGALKAGLEVVENAGSIPIPGTEKSINLLGGVYPPAFKTAKKLIDSALPTQEKLPEKILERGGRLVPSALLGPGGAATKGAQVLGGAIIGQGLEEAGAPDLAQAIGESLPFFFSGGKKIPLKANQKKLGDFLRKEGLTENEITPLLKTPEQIERWSKWAKKGGKKSKELMDSVYQKTGRIYEGIEQAAKNLPNGMISPEAGQKFLSDLSQIVEKMPSKFRNLIKQDASDLIKAGGHFNDFTNFYRDVNAVIGGEHGGRAVVGQFKGPILKAMESISPELADDFKLTTDLYRTRANVAGSILSRKQADELMDLGKIYGVASSIFNRDMGLMMKVLGAAGGRKLAREMLINPRLQNISTRIGEALKKNRFILTEKLMREFKEEVQKDDPELAQLIDNPNE